MNFITPERILLKLSREIKNSDLNDDDIYEMIGEVLGFLGVHGMYEEALAFMYVKNFSVKLPKGFEYVFQILKYNGNIDKDSYTDSTLSYLCGCKSKIEKEETQEEIKISPVKPVLLDCRGNPILEEGEGFPYRNEPEFTYFRPYLDVKYKYSFWIGNNFYKELFTPVKLSNKTFFGKAVFKEKNYKQIYQNSTDEYSFDNGGNLIFSFEEGGIALSYRKTRLSKEGLPMIPDNSSAISAITYYIKWKIAESMVWNRKEGFVSISKDMEKHYLKYARQFKNYMKMPKTLDEHQNLMEASFYNYNKAFNNYYNFGR